MAAIKRQWVKITEIAQVSTSVGMRLSGETAFLPLPEAQHLIGKGWAERTEEPKSAPPKKAKKAPKKAPAKAPETTDAGAAPETAEDDLGLGDE